MDRYTLHLGDAAAVLRTLPDNSVHCCVTSPPYYGLRDYGTAEWEGGGIERTPDGDILFECEDCGIVKPLSELTSGCPQCGQTMTPKVCDHRPARRNGISSSTLGGGKKTTSHQQEGYGNTCGKCGAVRIDKQIGLEQTPALYVARMMEVFGEVRRVLREDGVCWLNLGDSYLTAKGTCRNPGGGANSLQQTAKANGQYKTWRPNKSDADAMGLKSKDLLGIPWRVAFALQDAGWWLRQDIIWHKPNPMPESVQDRCTKAHEYVFLLTKSARYYYDAQAIAEPSTYPDDDRKSRSAASQKRMPTAEIAGVRPGSATYPTRNRRSVWTITTKPYAGAHFATMPPELAQTCILAGCPRDGIVLDPFAGSGTTLAVAVANGRRAIGIELNEAYAGLVHERMAAVKLPLFATGAPEMDMAAD